MVEECSGDEKGPKDEVRERKEGEERLEAKDSPVLVHEEYSLPCRRVSSDGGRELDPEWSTTWETRKRPRGS